MRDLKDISKKDALDLLDMINASLFCPSFEALNALVLRLDNLFFFEHVFCGMIDLKEVITNPDAPPKFFNIRYSEEYLQRYLAGKYHLDDPVYHSLLRTFQTQNWAEVGKQTPDFHRNHVFGELRDMGYNDGLTCGVRNIDFTQLSIFSFVGQKIENCIRTRMIIDYAAPSLLMAYMRLIQDNKESPEYRLTPRELEILKQLKEGKTSWEISMILNISERTVKFHIANLMQKLDAINRTQAVAIALQNRVIDL